MVSFYVTVYGKISKTPIEDGIKCNISFNGDSQHYDLYSSDGTVIHKKNKKREISKLLTKKALQDLYKMENRVRR